MKRYYIVFLISAVLAVFATASCQHNEHPMGLPSGEEVSVSISAVLPGDGGAVVKSAEDPGDGTMVNRCILEVYLIGDNNAASLYGKREIVKVTDLKASFEDLNLITGQKYRFVLWADYVDNPQTVEGLAADKFYNTDETAGLQNVTMLTADYAGNNDQRDAFFYTGEVTVEGPKDYTLELKRPFGQLNIITTDYGLIPEEHNNLLPVKVQLTYKNIPTGINLLTGELLTTDGTVTTQAVIGTAVDIAGPAVEGNDDAKQLSFDYIFAPANEQHLIGELTMSFLQSDGKTSTGITAYTFKSLPVQRNYRTNVSGALLTDRAGLSIEVKPGFDGNDIPVDADAVSVTTIEEAEAALADGAESVTISQPVSGAIDIPAATQDVTLTLMGLSGDITISGEEYSGMVTLNNLVQPENPVDLTINIPNGSFMLGRGTWSNVTVSTADNTFILGEDVSISGTLTVNKGNVEIYGRVENIEFKDENSLVTVFTVYDAVSLKSAASLVAQNRCAKIVLGADIDLQGSAENKWEPIDAENTKFAELDGAGHTISNLYVDNYTGNPDKDPYYYGGLFYVLQGDVRDLTIDGVNVTCHRGGALVGRMDYGIVENCHVKNAEIHSFQKAAGLIGFVSNSSEDVTVSRCSVQDCKVYTVAPKQGLYQAGGLIGYLQSFDRNVLVEGCSVSGISFDKVYESADTVEDKIYDMEQYYSHPFIGTVANLTTKLVSSLVYKVELKNNTVDQQMTDIPTCDRTNDFTGWWAGHFNSAGYMYSTKFIIDGETQDKWVEAKRLADQIAQGGDVTVWRSYDFTQCSELPEKIELRKPTTLIIKNNAVLTVKPQQLTNYSDLIVTGMPETTDEKNNVLEAGTITAKEYVLYNEKEGSLTINSGKFVATNKKAANGVAVYNRGECNIKDGDFEGTGFTVMCSGNTGGTPNITIENGRFVTSGNVAGYALTVTNNSTAIINGGYIEAIQTASSADVTINNGTFVNKIKYYAIYNAGANITINGGYFSGYTNMKDIYIASGIVVVNGGYFEDKEAQLPDGYMYKDNIQTIDGITYNYEVVPQQ